LRWEKIIKAVLMIKNQRKKMSNLLMLSGHCFFTKRAFSNPQFLRGKKNKPSETPTVKTKQPVKMLL